MHMNAEEYARHFATVSDRVLVELVDAPHDAHASAVEAARLELTKRGLSDTVISGIRSERQGREQEGEEWNAQLESITGRAKDALKQMGRTLVVAPDQTQTGERCMRFMLVAIGVMLLAVSPRFMDLSWLSDGDYDLSIAEHFLPLVILPITLIMLWKKHRIGWFLGAVVTTFYLVQSMASGYLNWNHQPMGFEAVDALFPLPTQGKIVGGILFSIGLAATFQVRGSLTVFRITEQERWVTVVPTVVLVLWMWSSLLN